MTKMLLDMCFDLTFEKIDQLESVRECDEAREGLLLRDASHREAVETLMLGLPCPMKPDVLRLLLRLQERRLALATLGSGSAGGGSGAGVERELELVPFERKHPAPAAASPSALSPNEIKRFKKQLPHRRSLVCVDIDVDDGDDDEGDGGGGSSGAPPPVPRSRG